MVNNIPGCNKLWCKIYRLLFLLFLAVFAIAPVADAYVDSLCPPPYLNDLNDADSPVGINDLKLNDARQSLLALALASRQNHDNRALFLCTLATDGPASRIIKPQLPPNDTCSSQRCSLVSSDPSPPVI